MTDDEKKEDKEYEEWIKTRTLRQLIPLIQRGICPKFCADLDSYKGNLIQQVSNHEGKHLGYLHHDGINSITKMLLVSKPYMEEIVRSGRFFEVFYSLKPRSRQQ